MIERTYHEVLSTVVHELLHPLWRSWLRTCVSTNNFIGLNSRPRDVACKKKMFQVKYIYKQQQINERYISFKLILSSASHVHCTERSRWCAWSPNHEFVCFNCRHRTVSVVRTAQTSHAQYIAAIYPLRCIAIWNPSKPPHHSSLLDCYLLH
jgi:hypothetical protein